SQPIMGSDLRSVFCWVDHLLLAVHDIVIDAVLDIRASVGNTKDALRVGFVLREEKRHVTFAVEISVPQFGMASLDNTPGGCGGNLLQSRPVQTSPPGPLVTEPERR